MKTYTKNGITYCSACGCKLENELPCYYCSQIQTDGIDDSFNPCDECIQPDACEDFGCWIAGLLVND